jgi:hypothetical protein
MKILWVLPISCTQGFARVRVAIRSMRDSPLAGDGTFVADPRKCFFIYLLYRLSLQYSELNERQTNSANCALNFRRL